MSFDPLSAPIDYALIAGKRTPGIAEIHGASSPRKWDERRGYGLSGATVVFRGVGLAKPVLTLRLYSAQDWSDWHEFAPTVQRPPFGTRPRALEIWHPVLEDLGVSSVVVEDVSQPEQTADGEWTITIKLIEFRRPVFTLARPEASQNRPIDPVDQQIIFNSAHIAVLNQELALP